MQGVPARGAQGGQANNSPHRDGAATKEVSYAMAYEDLVIVAKRRNAREIGVRIDASSAGRMTEGVTVAFPVQEGVELRASFFSGSARARTSRASTNRGLSAKLARLG